MESPESIGQWADETFGPIPRDGAPGWTTFLRAQKEWDELHSLFYQSDYEVGEVASEMADVCIVLMRGLNSLGYPNMIDEKMAINRTRQWLPDGTGHGQHIKEEQP